MKRQSKKFLARRRVDVDSTKDLGGMDLAPPVETRDLTPPTSVIYLDPFTPFYKQPVYQCVYCGGKR